jgi:organic radical activating enzyme
MIQPLYSLFYHLQKMTNKLPLVIPYLELCVTPRCTLRCRHCANLMQYYPSELSKDYPLEKLCASLENFIACVDSIISLRILGGEPLLHKGLPALLRYARGSGKVGRISVVTNGTLLPDDDTLLAMKETRAVMYISNYGDHSRKLDTLCKLLGNEGICFQTETVLTWRLHGFSRYGYTVDEVRDVYTGCDVPCKTLVNGELHICPRSAHGTALGVIEKRDADYVDIFSGNISERKRKIRALYDIDYVEACFFCKKNDDRIPIPAGEQDHG